MQSCDDYAEELGCDDVLNSIPSADVTEICRGCTCGGVPSRMRRLRGSPATPTTLTGPKPRLDKLLEQLIANSQIPSPAPLRMLDGHGQTACDMALEEAV